MALRQEHVSCGGTNGWHHGRNTSVVVVQTVGITIFPEVINDSYIAVKHSVRVPKYKSKIWVRPSQGRCDF